MQLQTTYNPPLLWRSFCTGFLGTSVRQALYLWQAIGTAPLYTELSWSLGAPVAQGTAYLNRVLTPQYLGLLLDNAVNGGRLPRIEANTFFERILAHTTASGAWR